MGGFGSFFLCLCGFLMRYNWKYDKNRMMRNFAQRTPLSENLLFSARNWCILKILHENVKPSWKYCRNFLIKRATISRPFIKLKGTSSAKHLQFAFWMCTLFRGIFPLLNGINNNVNERTGARPCVAYDYKAISRFFIVLFFIYLFLCTTWQCLRGIFE